MSRKRHLTMNQQIFLKKAYVDAAVLAEQKGGAPFEAAVLLLAIMEFGASDMGFLCKLTGFSYEAILIVLVRAKLAAILFDDGRFNFDVFDDCDDEAMWTITAILLIGCMTGSFIRTIDDKWRSGDQSDPDGANWPQHFAHGLIHCLGKRYVFERRGEAQASPRNLPPQQSCPTVKSGLMTAT
jgi:hypothetical protein